MGIDLTDITEEMRVRMYPADRKALGKRGLTNAEAREKYCTRTERGIHDQFTGFCKRNGFIVWHSNPVKKSSIRTGLPISFFGRTDGHLASSSRFRRMIFRRLKRK
jgi:hypothetical protein